MIMAERLESDQDLNSKNSQVISMCESLERKDAARPELPYDLEEPTNEREITRALMKLSAQTLSKYVSDEPDIY